MTELLRARRSKVTICTSCVWGAFVTASVGKTKEEEAVMAMRAKVSSGEEWKAKGSESAGAAKE